MTRPVGRPREHGHRVSKIVRVSPELDARMKATAAERGVSVNVLVVAAVEDYLARLRPLDEVLRTTDAGPPL